MANDDPETEEEQQRVTAHSYGALDVSEAGNECWLIRIPPAIAELWDRAPEGTDLGQLVFRKGGGGGGATSNNGSATATAAQGRGGVAAATAKPSITVHVNESLLEIVQQQPPPPPSSQQPNSSSSEAPDNSKKLPSVVPWNYSLQAMTTKVPVLHPFTRNPNNGSVKLLGIVSRTANLQVLQDQNYRALLKDRLVATSITGQRFVKPVEAAESVMTKQRGHVFPAASSSAATAGGSTTSNKKSFGNAISLIGKRLLEASQESSSLTAAQQLQQQQSLGHGGGPASKRARQFGPDQPIRSVLFELFQQQPYWSVKDLRAAAVAGGATHAGTKRAEAEIRDILRDIGEYHRSGDHKNMWELRKEFQTQS